MGRMNEIRIQYTYVNVHPLLPHPRPLLDTFQ